MVHQAVISRHDDCVEYILIKAHKRSSSDVTYKAVLKAHIHPLLSLFFEELLFKFMCSVKI